MGGEGETDAREISVLVGKLAELLKDLGVHAVAQHVGRRNVAAVLLDELLTNVREGVRLHVLAGTVVDALLIADDLGAEGLREATDGLTEVTLEELDDGRREVELAGLLEDVLFAQFVRNDELSKVADDLGGGSDLDDVAAEVVCLDVRLDDLLPLSGEAELLRLEHQVGVLTSGHGVLEDTW